MLSSAEQVLNGVPINVQERIVLGLFHESRLDGIVPDVFDVVGEVAFVRDDVIIKGLPLKCLLLHSGGAGTSAMEWNVWLVFEKSTNVSRTIVFYGMHYFRNVGLLWLGEEVKMIRHHNECIHDEFLLLLTPPNIADEHFCKFTLTKIQEPSPHIRRHKVNPSRNVRSMNMSVDHGQQKTGLRTLRRIWRDEHPSRLLPSLQYSQEDVNRTFTLDDRRVLFNGMTVHSSGC